jgi:hypothetical protein
MGMLRMAIRTVTAAKVIVTALVSAATPAGAASPVIPTLRAATPAELQSLGTCISDKPYRTGHNPPHYLPHLAQAQSLRLRVAHRPMATPVEVRDLSELRWRRFSRLRSL